MQQYFKDLINLFFPNNCIVCSKPLFRHENHICGLCIKTLPRTYFHLSNKNPLDTLFWGRVNVDKVISFLYYSKDNVVKSILHSFKYNGRKELAYELALLYCKDLCEINYFEDIDFVIPIPLHPKKLDIRGYNQSEWIAKGFCSCISAQIMTDNLYKKTHTSSQTNKGRYQRWSNINSSFDIRDKSILKNSNVLLVDDVLTTGATLEACASLLEEIPGININIATLAYATN